MQRIANSPNLITHGKTPVSLWMRSDPDDEPINNDMMIRVCTRGQDLRDDHRVQDIQSSPRLVHFALGTSRGEIPDFDLSIFGTFKGVSDDEIIIGKNADTRVPPGQEDETRRRLLAHTLSGGVSSRDRQVSRAAALLHAHHQQPTGTWAGDSLAPLQERVLTRP
jgi:hypothetical protein